MRRPVTALTSAMAAAVVAATVALTADGAQADLGLPVPSVSVPSIPLPSVSVSPVPLPTGSPAPSLPSLPQPSVSVPGGGGGGGTGGDGGAGTPAPGAGSATGTSGDAGDAAGPAGAATARPATTRAAKRKAAATPMVAGTDKAAALVDDESSPQLAAASEAFLAADQGIAEIARQKRLLAELKQDAAETAQLYRAMGYDVAGAQRVATGWHQRYDSVGDASVAELRRISDSATRADERVGDLVVAREQVRADFERIAARYEQAKRDLADANARLEALAAQRSSALGAVRAARGSDIALNQARLAESGELGAQIEQLSEQLARRGGTVQGTGNFERPLDGAITSPYGMRYHPILHYTKLHTGTDFAGGSVIRAADDGRVLMTIASTAYGYFTVIDHGVIDGKRLTTAYAHQSRFLVHPGEEVRKGEPIGIVGQTGYATGPHLHFEVRENGTVVDPIPFLARH
jgi:murein DD-endopeptidase MepM/ murein hydrolase activator NlpD